MNFKGSIGTLKCLVSYIFLSFAGGGQVTSKWEGNLYVVISNNTCS